VLSYLELKTLSLGPVVLQAWGMFVAAGIFVGAWLAARMARRRGLDGGLVWDGAVWMVAGAVVGARLFHVALYEPAAYLADPLSAVAIWQGGMSMFGGIAGALLAGAWFFHRKRADVWLYFDAVAYGLPCGIGVGRIGCFLIHDHPGTTTSFWLGVRYPDGSVRHDLGLYESLYGFALAAVFLLLARRNAKPPAYLVAFLASYGAFRFFMDFLRVIDARYFGLTPAQYLSVAMVVASIMITRCKLSAKK
jgi:phosphatidylglycerol:prolipoprotein diacylglycerol transferase